jgi:phenylalanyl-tRNA synthetase beta chain
MKISLNWLREYVDIDLPLRDFLDRLIMIGLGVEGTATIGNDVVLDVETYANRPDTLGHIGLAREVGAMLGRPLKERTWPVDEFASSTAELVDVQILDDDLCPRYCGLVVKGVKIGPSPDWLRMRIEAMGLKSINNIVDVSNYVLFATAQPIHAFDLAKLAGPRIAVRRAKKGETLRTLDGKAVALLPDMLVIADEKRPVAVAGVIGGLASAVSETTTDVFIESATFDPVSVRRTRKALEIQTDASFRYERGTDIGFPPQAALMAASLLTPFGGKTARAMADIYPKPRKIKEIVLRGRRVAELLGVAPDPAFIETTLERLGFSLKSNQPGVWRVQAPTFRVDIEREADLVEEIARFFGYDRIPSVVPALNVLESGSSEKERIRRFSQQLFHFGFDEVINSSFADPEKEAVLQSGFAAVAIRNPISSKASVLRTTLLGGLLENSAWNRNRGMEGVHIFEIGNIYRPEEGHPSERLTLGLCTTGPFSAPHWARRPEPEPFFHLKGALEAALEVLRYTAVAFKESPHAFFEEGRALAMACKGERIGRMGRVDGRLLAVYGIDGPVHAVEIDVSLLFDKQPRPFEYAPLPKFPAVVRDLSFLVDRTLPYQEIAAAVEKMSVPHLESFGIIDRYAGGTIPQDKASLSLRFFYRNPKATLTAEDVDRAEHKLLMALKAALKIQRREGGSA